MKYDGVIFDIDGTLWDSCATCAIGWNKVFAENGLDFKVSEKDINSVTGRPFKECVEMLVPGLDEKVITEISEGEKWALGNHGAKIYDGVIDGLKNLSKIGRIFLVSNCQDWYLDEFLEFTGIADFVVESDCNGKSRLSKTDMLKRLIERHNLKNPVYIGDTKGDMQAAEESGCEFICASYGFGEVKNAKLGFDSFEEIAKFLL